MGALSLGCVFAAWQIGGMAVVGAVSYTHLDVYKRQLDRAAMLTIMNPDDKAGLEAALRLKDQYGAEVTVVTMGLPKAEEVLREAMAMGADNGILVTDRVLGGADTWATSQTIAGALRNLDYDLIITGRQARCV